jgi:hypothetical protein
MIMMKTAAASTVLFPKRRMRTLSQLLTSSQQVANTLNWNHHSTNRLLLAIRLNGPNQLDLAVTSHPSCWSSPTDHHHQHGQTRTTTSSMTMPLDQGKTYLQDLLNNNNTTTTKRCNDTTTMNNIQGLIVGWPRQPDGGWLGYQCGKVLHFLDSIETSARPAICLFDGNNNNTNTNTNIAAGTTTTNKEAGVRNNKNVNTNNGDDMWGRNPIYGRITSSARAKRPHIASQEQYYPSSSSSPSSMTPTCRAADLADQFCRLHWPEYYQPEQQEQQEHRVDDDAAHHHVATTTTATTTTTDLWAAPRPSTFRGSLLPRSSVPMMPQHSSWMSTADQHHHQQHASATGMHHRRSLASA